MLNGAFAEHLYPGVTTIMTRARYLIFVPAIYLHLEQSGKAAGKDADKIARDMQFALRNALENNEENFIGRDGGRALIRVPSNIYWSALGALGISTRRISESLYQRQLSEGNFGVLGLKDDDDVVHDAEVESLWTQQLKLTNVIREGAFPDSTNFRLRRAEADFLESSYRALTPDGNENLVTRMVALGREHGANSLEDIHYPWEIPHRENAIAKIVEHARYLSLLARGTTLQYYRMLIERRGESDHGVGDAFVSWWDQAMDELGSWDTAAFFGLVTRWGAGRGTKDKEFISTWLQRCTASTTGQAALADVQARSIIARREDYVRPGKQRLRVKHQLETWKLPDNLGSDVYQMDYRHRVGRQIAMDIVEGLTAESA